VGWGGAPAPSHEVVEDTRSEIGFGRRKTWVGSADAEKDPFSEGHALTTQGVGASDAGWSSDRGLRPARRRTPRGARSTGGEAGRSVTGTLLPAKSSSDGGYGGLHRLGIGCRCSAAR
jgi:hypothetical protein